MLTTLYAQKTKSSKKFLENKFAQITEKLYSNNKKIVTISFIFIFLNFIFLFLLTHINKESITKQIELNNVYYIFFIIINVTQLMLLLIIVSVFDIHHLVINDLNLGIIQMNIIFRSLDNTEYKYYLQDLYIENTSIKDESFIIESFDYIGSQNDSYISNLYNKRKYIQFALLYRVQKISQLLSSLKDKFRKYHGTLKSQNTYMDLMDENIMEEEILTKEINFIEIYPYKINKIKDIITIQDNNNKFSLSVIYKTVKSNHKLMGVNFINTSVKYFYKDFYINFENDQIIIYHIKYKAIYCLIKIINTKTIIYVDTRKIVI